MRGPPLSPVAERLPPYVFEHRADEDLSCRSRIEAVHGHDDLLQGEESTGPTAALPLVSDDDL